MIGNFDKWIFPAIRPPWYRRLWQWIFPRKPFNFPNIMAASPTLEDIMAVQPMTRPSDAHALYLDFSSGPGWKWPSALLDPLLILGELADVRLDGYMIYAVAAKDLENYGKHYKARYMELETDKWVHKIMAIVAANPDSFCCRANSSPGSWATLSGREYLFVCSDKGKIIWSETLRFS